MGVVEGRMGKRRGEVGVIEEQCVKVLPEVVLWEVVLVDQND